MGKTLILMKYWMLTSTVFGHLRCTRLSSFDTCLLTPNCERYSGHQRYAIKHVAQPLDARNVLEALDASGENINCKNRPPYVEAAGLQLCGTEKRCGKSW